MGAMSGNRLGSETASGEVEDLEESDPGSSHRGGDSGVASRSTRDVVYLTDEAPESAAYHTSRLCPDFPGAGEVRKRPAAEDEGHPFCWTCFELEMRALAED